MYKEWWKLIAYFQKNFRLVYTRKRDWYKPND